jgi:hypothetical protein
MKQNQRTLGVQSTALAWIAVAALVSLGAFSPIAMSGEGIGKGGTQLSPAGCKPVCQIAGCPDDYCRKPSPCMCAPNCFLPDEYCHKPCLLLPCPTKSCCPDDYQPKPKPCPCGAPVIRWYKCVPYPCCDWLRTKTRDAPGN